MKKFSDIPDGIIAKLEGVHEEFFQTEKHSDEMPVTVETQNKLSALTPYWLNYETDLEGNPISSVVVMPTQRALGEQFLDGRITEKELMERTIPSDFYDAAYLCAAITVPHFRGQGITRRLFTEALQNIPLTKDAILLYWATSKEGERWVMKNKDILGKPILVRK